MWDDVFKDAALVVVDPQKGFSDQCNELPVPGASGLIPILNRLLIMPWKIIYATQDWHPANHCSFKRNGGPYPTHCVKDTKGAEFLDGLYSERFHAIFRKGFRSEQDAYSPHLDNPGFIASLLSRVKAVYVAGICTNICVFETAFDLYTCGVKPTKILEDACVSLGLPQDNPYEPDKVKKKAVDMGIKYVKAVDVLPLL